MQNSIANAMTRLREFAHRPHAGHSQCELCSARLETEHEHLVEIGTGQLCCSCLACALLFCGQTNTRFHRVPRDIRLLPTFRMTDAQWQNLSIPIGLAFLFESTRAGQVVAVYPSPAGGTESWPMREAWGELAESNPELRDLSPDVQALVVNRIDGARDYYVAPIDECYKLVGLVRARWRGFTGGVELWTDIAGYFASLKTRAHQCPI